MNPYQNSVPLKQTKEGTPLSVVSEEAALSSKSKSNSNSCTTHGSHMGRAIVTALVVVTLCAAVANSSWFGLGGGTTNTSITTSPPMAASLLVRDITDNSSARACTLDECFASNCNNELAPFTCLFHNGGPHGGCSATPWTPESCTEQCDLSGCDDLEIPDDADTCADVECDVTWCASSRVCGQDVSFQCTSGAACFGCSADARQWTLRSSDTTCNACCDTRTCK